MTDPHDPKGTPCEKTDASAPAAEAASAAHLNTASAKLSAELKLLLPEDPDKKMTIRDIMHTLQDRSVAVLLILFCVPFLQPIPMLGLSTPFGFVIGLLGMALALEREPWLPAFILNREVPRTLLKLLVEKGGWIVARVEHLLKPRLLALAAPGLPMRFHGINLAIMAFLLSLPIPFPWTNTAPAAAIMLLSLALLEKDGIFVILSYLAQLGTYIFFGVLGYSAYMAGTLGLSFLTRAAVLRTYYIGWEAGHLPM
ncbi:hypothetical protein DB346_16335 [Verrucomicrobia bacterium LW23]|nr:hypothetical protein DB346_16335 [Verrucomicrobia bacterium LW23]